MFQAINVFFLLAFLSLGFFCLYGVAHPLGLPVSVSHGLLQCFLFCLLFSNSLWVAHWQRQIIKWDFLGCVCKVNSVVSLGPQGKSKLMATKVLQQKTKEGKQTFLLEILVFLKDLKESWLSNYERNSRKSLT